MNESREDICCTHKYKSRNRILHQLNDWNKTEWVILESWEVQCSGVHMLLEIHNTCIGQFQECFCDWKQEQMSVEIRVGNLYFSSLLHIELYLSSLEVVTKKGPAHLTRPWNCLGEGLRALVKRSSASLSDPFVLNTYWELGRLGHCFQ